MIPDLRGFAKQLNKIMYTYARTHVITGVHIHTYTAPLISLCLFSIASTKCSSTMSLADHSSVAGDPAVEIVGHNQCLFGGSSEGSAGVSAFDAGPGSGDAGLKSNIS